MFVDNPEIAVVKSLGFFIVTSIGRPLGFLATFVVFSFAFQRWGMIRVALALTLASPILIANETVLFDMYQKNSFFDRLAIPLKELALGLILGLLASMPFYAYKFAGNMVDSYRGEGSNGVVLESADHDTTTTAIFFFVILITFIGHDGIYQVIQIFYLTYDIWPIGSYLPQISASSPLVISEIISYLFEGVLQIGLPLLILLVFVDLFIEIASKLAQKFNLSSMSFLLKNLTMVLLLPIYTIYIYRSTDTAILDVWGSLRVMEHLFYE